MQKNSWDNLDSPIGYLKSTGVFPQDNILSIKLKKKKNYLQVTKLEPDKIKQA